MGVWRRQFRIPGYAGRWSVFERSPGEFVTVADLRICNRPVAGGVWMYVTNRSGSPPAWGSIVAHGARELFGQYRCAAERRAVLRRLPVEIHLESEVTQ